MHEKDDHYWMGQALAIAQHAAERNEVPVGAVLVSADNDLLATGWNQPISACDPTAHAEMQTLRAAATKLGNYRLPNTTLYVTIEPCSMCAGALIHSRIKRLVIGALEPKAGAVISQAQLLDADFSNHKIDYTAGVRGDEASQIMADFFQRRRLEKKQASFGKEK